MIKGNPLIVGGAVVAVVAVAWLVLRGAGGMAKDISSGAVNAAGGVVAGTAQGLGDIIGLPATSKTQCEQDLAAGNKWAASASCPAGAFIKGIFQ